MLLFNNELQFQVLISILGKNRMYFYAVMQVVGLEAEINLKETDGKKQSNHIKAK